ncbi:winged helix-turn-helix transcriptional regulator [Salinivibrio costicola]|uniref:winged helix-turn-helix transcriptional regulator n=1 Tax=Salinivibrio costicola TaxID=51367 RepID=UPI0003956380|nr:winged helix-turn-helix transcriptional regulator [Salinivibrio costicola]
MGTRTQNAPVNDINAVDIKGLKTLEAIIALLAADKTLTRPQLAERIGKDIRTIGRALAKLQQAQRIKRVGSDKAGHWEVQS